MENDDARTSASEGVKVSEKKVAKALQAVCPAYHQARTSSKYKSSSI